MQGTNPLPVYFSLEFLNWARGRKVTLSGSSGASRNRIYSKTVETTLKLYNQNITRITRKNASSNNSNKPFTPHPVLIDKLYTQMVKVNRLRNRVEPFVALFWALDIVLANT